MLIPLLHLKVRMVRNQLAMLDRRTVLRTAAVASVMLALWGSSFWLLTAAFEFLLTLPGMGELLVRRTFALFFVTLFGMLSFSNLIIALRTVFRSDLVDQLIPFPIPARDIFWAQTVEGIVYASWPFVFIGLPFLVGYGVATGAGVLFYVATPLFLLPFIAICGFLGVGLCHLLVMLFPRLDRRMLMGVGLVLLVGLCVFLVQRLQFDALQAESWELMVHRLAAGLRVVQSPYLPSTWVSGGLAAVRTGTFSELPYYLCLLSSHALFFGMLLHLLAGRAYDRARADLASVPPARRSLLLRRRRTRKGPLSPFMALCWKDLRLFFREPAQWTQLLLFMLLVVIYLGSLRQAPTEYTSARWFQIALLVNQAAIALILGVLATRFVYPMLSLEGPGLWLIDLSPVSRQTLARQKVWASSVVLGVFALVITLTAAWFLRLPPLEVVAGVVLSFTLTVTLVALATGVGARLPRFDEPDPARILNGLGGTINFFVSFIYLFGILLIQAVGSWLVPPTHPWYPWALAVRTLLVVAVSLLVGRAMLRQGVQHLERLEM